MNRSKGKGLAASAIQVVLGLLLCGCGHAPAPANDEGRITRQVQNFLDRRAERLTIHDLEGYLESVEPTARATEERLARALNSLPVTLVTFAIHKDSLVKSGPSNYELSADIKYHYREFPEDNAFNFPVKYTLVLQRGEMRIQKSDPDAPPLWANGKVQQHQSQNFLILSRPATEGVEKTIEVAEAAREFLKTRLPVPQERQLIILAANAPQFEEFIGDKDGSTLGRAAQVRSSVEVEPTGLRITGRHMVVNLQQLAMDRNGPETLRHELAHLALALTTRPTTPGWLAEGAAIHLAGSRPTQTWEARLRNGNYDSLHLTALSQTNQLGAHQASDSAAEYEYAGAIVWYLVETHGEQRFWDFYSSFADRPPAELYGAFRQGDKSLAPLRLRLTQEAVQSLYGLTLDDLDRATRDWMQND